MTLRNWWHDEVLYQVYVRSFADANGDGVGDLRGLTGRLGYLADLGVGGLWLTPIFPSPMADFGYDIADYTDVHPPFGTLADMDRLIAQAHAKDIKIVLDIVPNHTSDAHPWFLASQSSIDDPQRDWYMWQNPGPDGGPPNNWLSRFTGESAWIFHEPTGQYYYATFLPQQPDLNWRNPEVRHAMADVFRFWLDRGVDGFRVDVVYRMIKDAALRDNPVNPDWTPASHPSNKVRQTYTRNRPEVHEVIRELRAVIDEYDDRLMFGEVNLPPEQLVRYFGDNDELHFPMNHPAIVAPWTPQSFGELITKVHDLLPEGAWPSWYLANHDEPRAATRVGADQVRVAMMLLLTMRGTPIIYYGDELGLENVDIPAELVQDPWEKNTPGLGLGRDPMRTPMPWDSSANAGFCPPDVTPWLPIGEDNQRRCVNHQRGTESLLDLTQRLLAFRRAHEALRAGRVDVLSATTSVLHYRRSDDADTFDILLNFSGTTQATGVSGDIIVATTSRQGRADEIELRPDEGLLIRIA